MCVKPPPPHWPPQRGGRGVALGWASGKLRRWKLSRFPLMCVGRVCVLWEDDRADPDGLCISIRRHRSNQSRRMSPMRPTRAYNYTSPVCVLAARGGGGGQQGGGSRKTNNRYGPIRSQHTRCRGDGDPAAAATAGKTSVGVVVVVVFGLSSRRVTSKQCSKQTLIAR